MPPVKSRASEQVWTWDFIFDRTTQGQSLKWLTIAISIQIATTSELGTRWPHGRAVAPQDLFAVGIEMDAVAKDLGVLESLGSTKSGLGEVRSEPTSSNRRAWRESQRLRSASPLLERRYQGGSVRQPAGGVRP